MRFISLILCCLFVSSSFAHDDPVLGEGLGHNLFHIIFFVLLVGVTVKGLIWFRIKYLKAKSNVG